MTSKKEQNAEYALLKDYMDHIPDVVYFKDTKGKLIWVNKAHAKGLKLSPQKVVGKTDFDIFPKERAEQMARDDRYVIRTGKPIIDKIERATRSDGVDNFVSTTKIPRKNKKGKIIGLIGVTRDITRRIQTERTREKKLQAGKKLELIEDLNLMKSEFISAVSHELRTPLAIIKQLFTLLSNETAGSINERQREILYRTKLNVERLQNIIDKLLDISHIERNKLILRYSLVNLKELLKDSQNFFAELAKEKKIQFQYKLPKENVSIFVDAERMLQVVTNLINNAIKFTEENGKVTVELKVLESKIRIGVIDTGVGIAKDDLARVFQKFVQVGRSEAERRKGIGLGLTIVRDLVERHGGEIWIESQLGVGTQCYFTLPRFHTAEILGKKVKEKTNQLLKENEHVSLINLVIINYEEFRNRTDYPFKKIFRDLMKEARVLMQDIFNEASEHKQIILPDIRHGRYTFIFPKTSEQKIADFMRLMKEKTKSYFMKNKYDNVFVALGMHTYSAQDKGKPTSPAEPHLRIREIYVGAEMRRSRRIPYQSKVDIVTHGNPKQTLTTVDISDLGLCFISPKTMKTDAKINLKLHLKKIKKTIAATARMAWMAKIAPKEGHNRIQYKIGIEFLSVNNADRKLLSKEIKWNYE